MATLQLDLSEADLVALAAEAARDGSTPEQLVSSLAQARAGHLRRAGADVVAVIDRQIAVHRDAFDRLAE